MRRLRIGCALLLSLSLWGVFPSLASSTEGQGRAGKGAVYVELTVGGDSETGRSGRPTWEDLIPISRWQFCASVTSDPLGCGFALAALSATRGRPVVSAQTYTISDVQQLPLPAGVMVVEPPGGYVLAGVPVNVYAVDSGSSDLSTVVLGIPVVVRVTPASWSWSFGDGGSVGPTSDPGGPYPTLTNSHAYSRTGSYAITMTTYYTAQLSVAGGPFEPIAGQASVASTPSTLR